MSSPSRALSSRYQHVRGEHLVAAVGDQDVVLDPDATEIHQQIDLVPGHRVVVTTAVLRAEEDRGDEVHARFDGRDEP